TLQGPTAEWFQHLPAGSITSWATLQDAFEDKYKPSKYAFTLLSQITHLKKEANETMHDFIARFKSLINRVLAYYASNTEKSEVFLRKLYELE
ncbi:hypothetical protein KI387_001365, partial [Taxus chinensis]